jgi:hypothetical protein
MATKPNITHEQVLKALDYDPETGIFFWKVSRCGVRKGSVAGCKNKEGYWKIGIGGTVVLAHRLAFFYMTGAWPDKDIDHKNCDKLDNRWNNIREATRAQNVCNTGLKANNTSGYKGVIWSAVHNKYVARITVKKIRKTIGYFSNIEDAAQAYKNASTMLHGEFANHG